ncbi:MAG: hypothetical protein ACI4MH_01800 [Candidatus Coproplasma sp.]
MKKFKPNLIEYFIALVILPFLLMLFAALVVIIFVLVKGGDLGVSLIPWQVYLTCGLIVLLMNLSYFAIYFLSKNYVVVNEKKIVYVKKGIVSWEIEKEQIEKIVYKKTPWILSFIRYENYGALTIYCNEANNYVKINMKIFRLSLRIFKNFGYNIISVKS